MLITGIGTSTVSPACSIVVADTFLPSVETILALLSSGQRLLFWLALQSPGAIDRGLRLLSAHCRILGTTSVTGGIMQVQLANGGGAEGVRI
ncbi:hypothetical protein Q4S45_13165 [Massilia sp. R2A-15]|uniref:hypothetical protein n=1 Tax=Massilia sp. R2A-15 TaxID=3064278 RepID=UPI002732AA1C|nr:hypothetical protein [Massilia sp. R2A-15]WLI87691.1 hypothetical protein Q4S45_13165 [Massilia sp. R2A-15]